MKTTEKTPQDVREAVLRNILAERLDGGWGRGPELLQVFGSIMGTIGEDQTMLAVVGDPFVQQATWAGQPPLLVLEATAQVVVCDDYQQGRRAFQRKAAAEHGTWLGVLFMCEATLPAGDEMLVATLVGGAGEWATLTLLKYTPAELATLVFSEDGENIDPELLGLMKRIAIAI